MRELFNVLASSRIPALIIGGHALAVHGVQRNTVDLDCMVVAENRELLTEFLRARGFDEMSRHKSFSRFRHQSLVYPLLDVMEVDARTWSKMEPESVAGVLYGHSVRVPALAHLVALKLHAMKQNPEREPKDLSDIVHLVRGNRGAISDAALETLCGRYAPAGYWAKLRNHL